MIICFFQVQINLNEKNDVTAIKNYLTTDLGAPYQGGWKRNYRRRRAFENIYKQLKEASYGDRPSNPNFCFLLVNKKKTNRYLRRTNRHLKKSGIDKYCHHTFVFNGEDKIDLAEIRKEICPEAELIRGMYA